jgi:SanA protein
MNANGFIADRREYRDSTYYAFREFFANIKAFMEVLIGRQPRFLGKTIPITGDGRLSWN